MLVYALFHKSCENIMFVLLLYSGFGVILGHNFPFYMKFKGGKGIAASAGMITSLAIYDWKFVVLGFFVFFISLYITKYVSFSSLMLMGSLLIEMIVWGQLGMVHNLNPECRIEAYIITGLMTALAFIRHKDNNKKIKPKVQNEKLAKRRRHNMSKITVLGGGGWAIALAMVLNDNGHNVTIWSAVNREVEALKNS